MRSGPTTTRNLAELLGRRSGGRVDRQLGRLRQLGLIGYQGVRGRRGCIRWWFPASARRAYRGAHGRRLPRGNDSLSTPFGGFITARGVAGAWTGRHPPRFGRSRRPHRPPSGAPETPPRVLYAKCPAGHQSRIGRRSWRRAAGELRAEWRGTCRRCSRAIRELVVLQLPLPEPRAPSAAELADPSLRARRAAEARRLVADPATGPELRETLTRDYLSGPPAEPTRRDPGDW